MNRSKINYYLNLFGFYPKKSFHSLKGLLPYLRNLSQIKYQLKGDANFDISTLYPCLDDRYEKAGTIPKHYFYQDLIIANKIYEANPKKHVDIGSRIDGFVAHVACFREIEVFDIRDFDYKIPNVKFVKADLMESEFNILDYCDSVSCLHAIEHFGLGRYGDNIDITGHIKGLTNIYKMLKPNGIFYFSAPIGKQRIEYDAHRVFSIQYLLDIFKDSYQIKSFSYINDDEELFTNVEMDSRNIINNFNCSFGCGIFELVKK